MSVQQALLNQSFGSSPGPPITLPDTFYVAWRVMFSASELSNVGDGGLFALNGPGIGASEGVYGLSPFYTSGSVDHYDDINVFMQWNAGSDSDDYDISGTPIIASTWYVFDQKFEFAVDHLTFSVTTRLDGSTLGTLNATANPANPYNITSMLLGSISGNWSERQFDYFTVGTTTYGSSDLFNADFSTLSPFDSLVGTGISITGGVLDINNSSGGTQYALKACN